METSKKDYRNWFGIVNQGVKIFFYAGIFWLIQGCAIPVDGTPIPTNTTIPTDAFTNTPAVTSTSSSTPQPSLTYTPFPTATGTPTAEPTIEVIDTIVSERDGMTLVYVPEGEFMMGADARIGFEACKKLLAPYVDNYVCSKVVYSDEEPVHAVWLDEYWVDQTEVTNAMYAAFLNQVGNKVEWGDPWYGASNPEARIQEKDGVWVVEEGYEDHPVTLVTWHGAHSYCERVGRRLPTEAEWEKAARGTDERIYPWGDEFNGEMLNFCDRDCEFLANSNYDDGYETTAPVGSYPQGASPYGALDMAGNVREWVFDRYARRYYERSEYRNPDGPDESLGDIRVWRGGSWSDTGDDTRITGRHSDVPTHEWIDIGFRCVLSDPSQ